MLTYFKELAHAIMGVANLNSGLAGWRPREKLMLQRESESSLETVVFFSLGLQWIG